MKKYEVVTGLVPDYTVHADKILYENNSVSFFIKGELVGVVIGPCVVTDSAILNLGK